MGRLGRAPASLADMVSDQVPERIPYEQITYSVADRIATIALDRADARNGFTLRMAEELVDAFDRADADEDVRAVVFTGNGDHFCVGLDLSGDETAAVLADAEKAGDSWAEPAGRVSMRIYAMRKVVIAAVRGAAAGAGATLTLPADYRLLSTDARYGFVFTRRGIFAEGASTWFLPRVVGLGCAMDWLISGRAFDAQEALSTGLAHSVHDPEQLMSKAYQLAQAIVAKSAPVSVAVIRQMVYQTGTLESPVAAHRLESQLIRHSLTSADTAEGFDAFITRREPVFPGRVDKDLPDFMPPAQPWRHTAPAAPREEPSHPEQSPNP